MLTERASKRPPDSAIKNMDREHVVHNQTASSENTSTCERSVRRDKIFLNSSHRNYEKVNATGMNHMALVMHLVFFGLSRIH